MGPFWAYFVFFLLGKLAHKLAHRCKRNWFWQRFPGWQTGPDSLSDLCSRDINNNQRQHRWKGRGTLNANFSLLHIISQNAKDYFTSTCHSGHSQSLKIFLCTFFRLRDGQSSELPLLLWLMHWNVGKQGAHRPSRQVLYSLVKSSILYSSPLVFIQVLYF